MPDQLAARCLTQIADNRSMMVPTVLNGDRLRLNGVRRQLAGVTQKAFTQSLCRLERNGLVARQVILISPVAVEYGITDQGPDAAASVLGAQRLDDGAPA